MDSISAVSKGIHRALEPLAGGASTSTAIMQRNRTIYQFGYMNGFPAVIETRGENSVGRVIAYSDEYFILSEKVLSGKFFGGYRPEKIIRLMKEAGGWI